ncbi:hypothetical protein DFQ30_008208 [Apophysomyces sp. BC1015]|nr:hypothetical protein DFQ30_008208 [Apophysomyces sp. BC1015]
MAKDKASMVSRAVPETVSRYFQDMMKIIHPQLEQVPFGGKLVVFGGGFRLYREDRTLKL